MPQGLIPSRRSKVDPYIGGVDRNLGIKDLETSVVEASKNILKIITHGDKAHTLRKEDDVLLIGDQRDLSPMYT